MDDRNKGGPGGGQSFTVQSINNINVFWQVLPFGESKGPCRTEKQKGKDKSGLHFDVKKTSNQKQIWVFKEWTYFLPVSNGTWKPSEWTQNQIWKFRFKIDSKSRHVTAKVHEVHNCIVRTQQNTVVRLSFLQFCILWMVTDSEAFVPHTGYIWTSHQRLLGRVGEHPVWCEQQMPRKGKGRKWENQIRLTIHSGAVGDKW